MNVRYTLEVWTRRGWAYLSGCATLAQARDTAPYDIEYRVIDNVSGRLA